MVQRRFSLEDDFMNYNTDDLLYGAMQHLATFHPDLKKLYLTKQNYSKYGKELRTICNVSTRTLSNHLKKLEEKGLVQEATMLINNEEVAVFLFPYDYDSNYQLINNEMLWYIISTRNHQAVRVYLQLLNWYKWKQNENNYYSFTVKELMGKIGYATNFDNRLVRELIDNILESFQREGVIDFADYYETIIDKNGHTIQMPKKRLLFVAAAKNEMKNR